MNRNQLLWVGAAVVAIILMVWIFMVNQRPATTADVPPAATTTEAPATTETPVTTEAPAATETPATTEAPVADAPATETPTPAN